MTHRRHPFSALLPLLLSVAGSAAPVQWVIAADYLTVPDAQQKLFPKADQFQEVVLVLSAAQKQQIATLAGTQPVHGMLRVWRAMQGTQLLGHVLMDEVIGRQDLITYAVAIDATGKLSPIEVMTYRESHGGEIRNPAWRKQFQGRSEVSQLRPAMDIKNIAGATLSSEHVTQGVRWLLALWQTTLQTGAP